MLAPTAPDGTRIAFTSDRDNRRLSKERLGRGSELYTMALDGTGVVRVTSNRRPDLFPDSQPLPCAGQWPARRDPPPTDLLAAPREGRPASHEMEVQQ